jgi:hypothetical protein
VHCHTVKLGHKAIFGNPNRPRSQRYHPRQHRIIGQPKRTCSPGSIASLQLQREDACKLRIDFGVDMTRHHAFVAWKINVTGEPCSITTGI